MFTKQVTVYNHSMLRAGYIYLKLQRDLGVLAKQTYITVRQKLSVRAADQSGALIQFSVHLNTI